MKLTASSRLFNTNCSFDGKDISIEDSKTGEMRKLTAKEKKAVNAEVLVVEAEIKAKAYKAKRAAEYPPMHEYLDAIVNDDLQAQNDYIMKCKKVKQKYPKVTP